MTIREVAAKTNMSTDTLRYYERIGLLPPVPRNAAGIRTYDEYFVDFINFIKNLKASGMSLEHIIDYIQLAKKGRCYGPGTQKSVGRSAGNAGPKNQQPAAGGGTGRLPAV